MKTKTLLTEAWKTAGELVSQRYCKMLKTAHVSTEGGIQLVSFLDGNQMISAAEVQFMEAVRAQRREDGGCMMPAASESLMYFSIIVLFFGEAIFLTQAFKPCRNTPPCTLSHQPKTHRVIHHSPVP